MVKIVISCLGKLKVFSEKLLILLRTKVLIVHSFIHSLSEALVSHTGLEINM